MDIDIELIEQEQARLGRIGMDIELVLRLRDNLREAENLLSKYENAAAQAFCNACASQDRENARKALELFLFCNRYDLIVLAKEGLAARLAVANANTTNGVTPA